jgi:hypothetical protein
MENEDDKTATHTAGVQTEKDASATAARENVQLVNLSHAANEKPVDVQQPSRNEKRMVFFTGVLAVFTICYALVSAGQWWTIHEQMINGQRAWVVAEGADCLEFKLGEHPSARIRFLNGGNTPAAESTIDGQIAFRATPVPDPMPLAALHEGQMKSKVVIAPHAPMFHNLVLDAIVFDEKTIAAVNNGKIRLYLWGVANYKDIFGHSRKTTFYMVHKAGTLQFDACENHNTIE